MLDIGKLAGEHFRAQGARVRAAMADLVTAAVLMLVAAAMVAIGLVFVLVGAYQSLVQGLPPWQAGGIVGLAVLVVAGVLALVARGRARGGSQAAPPRTEPPPQAGASAELRQATEQGVQAGEALKRSGVGPVDLALAAFVAGLVVARRGGGPGGASRPDRRRR